MPKSDLTYHADGKTEDDTSIMENITDKIKAAPREDGQNIQDYIQKQGTHTGIIGAITGTVSCSFCVRISRNDSAQSPVEPADAGCNRKPYQ